MHGPTRDRERGSEGVREREAFCDDVHKDGVARPRGGDAVVQERPVGCQRLVDQIVLAAAGAHVLGHELHALDGLLVVPREKNERRNRTRKRERERERLCVCECVCV